MSGVGDKHELVASTQEGERGRVRGAAARLPGH